MDSKIAKMIAQARLRSAIKQEREERIRAEIKSIKASRSSVTVTKKPVRPSVDRSRKLTPQLLAEARREARLDWQNRGGGLQRKSA